MKIIKVIAAGMIGGAVNSLGIWLSGAVGINQALGFNMAPALTASWLMPRLISSGLWGLLFLLPFWNCALIKKGVVLSLGPLALMLFMVFPKMGAGMLGMGLGTTAPLFALVFSLIWGVTAALFLKVIAHQPTEIKT
ncbi:MAG: hypothetical protein HY885_01730 [Deltaproteobacteria bacterium]|nr:hypothetical protein [Deltaproteobacteria bacterium]